MRLRALAEVVVGLWSRPDCVGLHRMHMYTDEVARRLCCIGDHSGLRGSAGVSPPAARVSLPLAVHNFTMTTIVPSSPIRDP
ncbi:hypothetical protein EDC01DRAFT_433005 [Geopyxis carbonaria]|nr:hypothetical protein EDC01DRAFT_433005 [Geopyxis carbonaria]